MHHNSHQPNSILLLQVVRFVGLEEVGRAGDTLTSIFVYLLKLCVWKRRGELVKISKIILLISLWKNKKLI